MKLATLHRTIKPELLDHSQFLLTAEAAELGSADTTPDNLYMIGTFRLMPDQSLRARVRPPRHPVLERHAGEHLARVCGSATPAQLVTNRACHPGPDGMVRIAIAAEDFGDGHWLDTGGRHRGFVILRWLDNPIRPMCTVATTRQRVTPSVRSRPLSSRPASWRAATTSAIDAPLARRAAPLADGLPPRPGCRLGGRDRLRDILRALTNRLGSSRTARRTRRSPAGEIDQPIFIVGQPRTGTTILYDLLAQDPDLRPPLTWEVDYPVSATAARDIRRRPPDRPDAGQHRDVRADRPGLPDVPPDGRTRRPGVRADLRPASSARMIFSVQYRLPVYYRWLLYDADHAPATAITESSCSTCSPGSRAVAAEVARTSVAARHLVAEYPDALIVQTHRDPLNVISSIAALTTTCAGWPPTNRHRRVRGAVLRGDRRRPRPLDDVTRLRWFAGRRVIDVQFADFMRDPFVTVRSLYDALGRDLEPVAEQRMRDFLAAHPGDGGGDATAGRTPVWTRRGA